MNSDLTASWKSEFFSCFELELITRYNLNHQVCCGDVSTQPFLNYCNQKTLERMRNSLYLPHDYVV